MEPSAELLKMLNTLDPNRLSKQDFVKSWELVVQKIRSIQLQNEQEISAMREHVRLLSDKVDKDVSTKLSTLQDGKDGIPGREGRPGKDAKAPALEEIIPAVLDALDLPEQRAVILDGPEEIRNKLELLQEDERLDASALKNVRMTPEDQKVTRVVGSHGPLSTLIDVNVTGLVTGQSLKWDGTQWVVYTPGAGGGFTTLAATETPNANLKIFTFSTATAQPSFIISDGIMMQATAADGTVNWTYVVGTKKATMTIPPTSDILGIV